MKISWKSRRVKWTVIGFSAIILFLGLSTLTVNLLIETALKELATDGSKRSQMAVESNNQLYPFETQEAVVEDNPSNEKTYVEPNSQVQVPEKNDIAHDNANESTNVSDENLEKNMNETNSDSENQAANNAQSNTLDEKEEENQDNKITYEANISPEKAELAQEEITLGEKAKLTSMLLSKLTPKEVSLFIKMTSNGVSIEEKKAAKKIILEKLTPEEFDELIVIAQRLGLSEGRPYEETVKDYEDEKPTP